MGMFDWVKYECRCDYCNGKVTGFQPKSGKNILDVVSPLSVDEFYSYCDRCDCRVSFTRLEDNKYLKTTQRKVKIKEIK